MKLIQFPWITYFFQIFKTNPLCVVLNHNEPGPKGPMPHEKGLSNLFSFIPSLGILLKTMLRVFFRQKSSLVLRV
jgi:hypothetical protein